MSGSVDNLVIVWDLVGLNPSASSVVKRFSSRVLRGHETPIYSLDVSANMDLVVSGSRDRIIIHSLQRGEYIRQITMPAQYAEAFTQGVHIVKICAETARIVAYSQEKAFLAVFDINGQFLMGASTADLGVIRTILTTNDGKHLLTAGERIAVWSTHNAGRIGRPVDLGGMVSCAQFSPDESLLFLILSTPGATSPTLTAYSTSLL